jgi:hypothetical protein
VQWHNREANPAGYAEANPSNHANASNHTATAKAANASADVQMRRHEVLVR